MNLADCACQSARRVVGAEILAITSNEFLTPLIGTDAILTYEGYDQRLNVGVSNEFSQLLWADEAGAAKEIPLSEAFPPDPIACILESTRCV